MTAAAQAGPERRSHLGRTRRQRAALGKAPMRCAISSKSGEVPHRQRASGSSPACHRQAAVRPTAAAALVFLLLPDQYSRSWPGPVAAVGSASHGSAAPRRRGQRAEKGWEGRRSLGPADTTARPLLRPSP